MHACRDSATQMQLLDRVAGTSELAAHMRQLAERARQLEHSLDELDQLADEEERSRMQELCSAVGSGGEGREGPAWCLVLAGGSVACRCLWLPGEWRNVEGCDPTALPCT